MKRYCQVPSYSSSTILTNNQINYYKKTRKQQSKLFIRMGLFSCVYVLVLYFVENFTTFKIPEGIHTITITVFPLASIILFSIAWWFIKNPTIYEAIITESRFSILYPFVREYSFDVEIDNIVKMEHKQSHSSGGKSRLKLGLL